MSGLSFASAMRQVPDPPCDECPQSKRCGVQKLMCLDFARYVSQQDWSGPSDRNASSSLYERMYRFAHDE